MLFELGLASFITVAAAQSSVTISSSGSYNGAALNGYHVGAGQSYEVAGTGSAAASGSTGFSISGGMLMNSDIVQGEAIPCYVMNTASISSNSGALECGVSDQSGYHDQASVSSTGAITFSGISAWYVCSVASGTGYGTIANTIVGVFGSGAPTGAGVSNCVAVNGLVLSGSNTTTTNTTSSATISGSPAPYNNNTAPYSNTTSAAGTVITIITSACSTCPQSTIVTSTVCPCTLASTTIAAAAAATSATTAAAAGSTSTGSGSGSSGSSASGTTASPATYTGAASPLHVVNSAAFALVLAGLAAVVAL